MISATDPWCVHTKGSHSLYEGWKHWLITKQRKNQPPPAPLFSTTYARAYEDPLPIKKEKHRDLMKMLAYMPAEAQAFYVNVKSSLVCVGHVQGKVGYIVYIV